jgi:chromate reductase
MQVLALSGSLRSGSHSSELLRRAGAAAPDHVEVVLYEGMKEIPPYDADDDRPGDQPAPVERLKAALADADAVLVATPEYNHSIPGVLKNALDWVSRPILESPVRNKPAAVLSSSTGMFGGVWAAAETRKVLGALGARVLDQELPVARAPDSLDDPELLAPLEDLLQQLIAPESLTRAA